VDPKADVLALRHSVESLLPPASLVKDDGAPPLTRLRLKLAVIVAHP